MEIGFEALRAHLARQAEQTAWRERSVERISKTRADRVQALTNRAEAIKDALQAYQQLDRGNVPSLPLRRTFVRFDSERPGKGRDAAETGQRLSSETAAQEIALEVASRPPMGRLLHRQTNALSLFLTAVYVAQLETEPRHAYVNQRHNIQRTAQGDKPWSVLTALHGPKDERTRRARIRRSLNELQKAGLVKIDQPGRYRHEHWLLLSDDGTESSYVVPGENIRTGIRLPATFFLRGWHLVLEPGEIAMLLAIMDAHWRLNLNAERGGPPRRWIALPRKVRRERYGISDEIYLCAQQLHEFGLVDFHDPMPQRRRGKLPSKATDRPHAPMPLKEVLSEDGNDKDADGGTSANNSPPEKVPYAWRPVPPEVFDRPALDVVRNTLTALPVPHRLASDWPELTEPQDYVQMWLKAERAAGRRPAGR